jgi:MFS family permease
MRKYSRLIGASIIGNTLEWYEFSLYLHFTPLFSVLFFPKQVASVAFIYTLLIFGLGFVSRLVGGIIFGHIGDKFGRRKALLATILLIAFPTGLIAFLPTYAAIGIAAPIILASIRLLQGFPAGGEFPGVMCYLVEMAGPHQRNFFGSFAFLGSQLGSILSTTEFLLFETFFEPETFVSWGWRISFGLGALLGLFGFFLRRKLLETHEFEKVKRLHHVSSKPLFITLKMHKKALLKGIFLSVLPLSGWYLIFVFTPLFFSEVLKMDFITILILNIGMLLLSNIFLPFLGRLADQYDKKRLLILSAACSLLLAFPFYSFAITHSFLVAILFEIALIFFMSMQFAILPDLLCSLFPTEVRYTCVGISYNLCNALLGGITPAIAFTLIHHTDNLLAPAFLLVGSSLIALLCQWRKQ